MPRTSRLSRSRRFARLARLVMLASVLLSPGAARAEERAPGQVTVPLGAYTELIERLRGGEPGSGSARVALGPATLSIDVQERDGGLAATVQGELTVKVLRAGLAATALLPNGTTVTAVSVDGQADALVATPEGLAVALEGVGQHRIAFTYVAWGQRQASGSSIAVPVPAAPSTQLSASLPGSALSPSRCPRDATSA